MQLPAYDLYTSDDSLIYEFDSISPAKTIRKVIAYDPFPDNPQVFNLSLGDKLADGTVNDLVRSNNDDLEKVMATVAKTLLTFFNRYPDSLVYFKGSTDSRTRLYQIVLAQELEQARQWFIIEGITPDGIEKFTLSKTYQAFLLRLKK